MVRQLRFRYRNAKRSTHRLLTVGKGGRAAKVVDLLIAGLIVCNVIAITLETIHGLFVRYRSVFYYFNVFSVGVFTVEYVLRVWSATAANGYGHPIFGRL